MLLLILTTLLQTHSKLPEWFFESPPNTISVVVNDSYYDESRMKSLEKEANRLLQIQAAELELYGYEALEKGNSSKQFDKFELVYRLNGMNPERDMLKEMGYVLLDHQRINERKYVVGLFGKEGTSFNDKRIDVPEKPDWLKTNVQNKTVASGFALNNYYMMSNWISAFKHALFNLAGSNNTYIYKNQNQQTNSNDDRTSKSYYNVQLHFVEAVVHGARVTNRWIDPSDGSCHIRIKTGDDR
ncbi:MAG: hypothetical protein KDD94_06340 [Calditrichaeota bacterium]|nr:hypothetical protein [Calditrichota bacterium]